MYEFSGSDTVDKSPKLELVVAEKDAILRSDPKVDLDRLGRIRVLDLASLENLCSRLLLKFFLSGMGATVSASSRELQLRRRSCCKNVCCRNEELLVFISSFSSTASRLSKIAWISASASLLSSFCITVSVVVFVCV